jgi:hypothetical protein
MILTNHFDQDLKIKTTATFERGYLAERVTFC